jgi:hypothetical protein
MSYGSKTAGLAEHWDVIQDEATRQEPKERTSDVRDTFPDHREW